jgi:hypothetical protein
MSGTKLKVIINIYDYDYIDFYQEEIVKGFRNYMINEIGSKDFDIQALDEDDDEE